MTETGNAYVERYPEWRDGLPGRGLAWLSKLRTEAFARFAERGFPTRKTEAWKYTNLTPLTKRLFEPAAHPGKAETALPAGLPDETAAHRIVFVNGRPAADGARLNALPEGVRLMTLGEALEREPELLARHLSASVRPEEPALFEMNTALMTEGAVLVLAPGVAMEKPVHLFFLTTDEAADKAIYLRNLIVAGKGSRADVFESYLGTGKAEYWMNVVTEIVAEEGAHLRHYKLQDEGKAAYHVAMTVAKIGDHASYDSFAMSRGSALARNEIQATLDGSGIDCRLNGIHLARDRQHLDTTTVIDHAKPGSHCDETYKSVVDDHAETVFQGKIIVRPNAQKTEAHQMNRNLLLSDEARANTKPELRIHADDVQCSHGATVSELDEQALFYLRSRGIAKEAARSLLTEAFIAETIDAIENAPVREAMRHAMANWLGETSGMVQA
ncbi:MAG: Fe-S cluster assembly protein SufD [Alphaproteobacteria bacterium]